MVNGRLTKASNKRVPPPLEEADARYTSNTTTAGWEEYATARKKVKEMVEIKRRRDNGKT